MDAEREGLAVLLARLEAATGPDRELDREIEHVVCGVARPPVGMQIAYPTRYTESLDAAVALVERVLPGWAWSCGTCVVSDDGWVKPDVEGPDAHLCDLFDDGFFGDAKGGSVPLSLLVAMMHGLIAKSDVAAGRPFKSHMEARREAMEKGHALSASDAEAGRGR